MSKSSGNFLTLDKLAEEGISPMVYKFFCLQSHYRRQLILSSEGLEMAKSAYEKLIKRINALKEDNSKMDAQKFEELNNKFKDALAQDLNTSLALTRVFDALKSDASVATKIALIKSFDSVLNLNLTEAIGKEEKKDTNNAPALDSGFEEYILDLIEKRKEAKASKNYAQADDIRAKLLEQGVELIDTKEGTTYKRK